MKNLFLSESRYFRVTYMVKRIVYSLTVPKLSEYVMESYISQCKTSLILYIVESWYVCLLNMRGLTNCFLGSIQTGRVCSICRRKAQRGQC